MEGVGCLSPQDQIIGYQTSSIVKKTARLAYLNMYTMPGIGVGDQKKLCNIRHRVARH